MGWGKGGVGMTFAAFTKALFWERVTLLTDCKETSVWTRGEQFTKKL